MRDIWWAHLTDTARRSRVSVAPVALVSGKPCSPGAVKIPDRLKLRVLNQAGRSRIRSTR